ncbi:MAG: sensor domain-containing diguanylate cyclase [Alphaproteobacteria bacterium]|nr:sensor domain-containing diguanylate cyclase [Alphaproteobacteria bacterium]
MLNKSPLRHFLLLLIPTTILFWGVILGVMHVKIDERKAAVQAVEVASIKLGKQAITHELAVVASDLRVLAQYGFVSNPNDTQRGFKAEDLLIFAKEKPLYDQIRFINLKGMEVGRVNFNNGNPAIVPENMLQFKGARYYFKNGLAAPKGTIYISRFDLNKERGKVELPLKPMLRFVMPTYDEDGKKKGVFVLNYLGQRIINNFSKMTSSSIGQKMIINDLGYWLLGPNKKAEWGFMFNNGKTINTLYPSSWAKLKAEQSGQFTDKNGLFSFDTVYPGSELGGGEAQKVKTLSDAGSWKIVSFIPTYKYQRLTGDISRLLWLVTIPIYAAICFGLWWLSHFRNRGDNAVEQLKIAFEGLDSQVQERTRELRQEITERKALEAQLRKIAWTDELTDLLNRRAFLEAAEKENDRFMRYGTPYTVLMLDLDHFKKVNDTYGHHAGDLVLSEMSKVLKRMVRKTDVIGRIGGEEIAFILPKTEPVVAVQLAERIRKHLETLVVTWEDQKIRFTASIGVAQVKPGTVSFSETMDSADKALYQAKESGRNQVCLYEEVGLEVV